MSFLKDLAKFQKKEKISMHIPGHKNGRGLGSYFKKNAMRLDVTELCGTDNLRNPVGIIKKAQDNCAGIFGAYKTFFLTGGSSLGLRAAILGMTRRGDKLLVDRTCHCSVISAITLGGIEPVFISPAFNKEKGLYTGIYADEVNCILAQNPDIAGAVITSPTYYGVCSDITAIAKCLHGMGKFLIVDEAHGAHFSFSKKLPMTALSQGADICIQSAHKTLPSLGQSSFMHISDRMKNSERLERVLKMIQSTSPSYMLMASLDEAARYMNMNTCGRRRIAALISEAEKLKKTVREKTVLRFADSEALGVECDGTRIVVDFADAEISGSCAEEILAREYGIYAEMADGRYVVLVPSVANSIKEIRRLCDALVELGGRRIKGEPPYNMTELPEIRSIYSPSCAHDMPSDVRAVASCIGSVSAEIVSACPPGAAVLIPGQYITKEAAEYIIRNKVADTVEVIKE